MDEAAIQKEAARVLVADDDPLVRQLAVAAMRAEGLAADEAADGEETLRLAARIEPDLILLDVRMPRKDGFAVLEALRADPRMRDVPVLVMTGCEDHDSIERAYGAGATDFVVKPIQWTILRHRVRYLIRASTQLLQLQRSERALAAAQRIAGLGSWALDFDGTFSFSEEIPRMFGAAPGLSGDAMLREMNARVHPEDLRLVEHCLRDAARETRPYTTDYRVLLPNGDCRYVHMEARGIRDERGSTLRIEGILQDVTARKRAEEEARYLAYHDSLTGLANRRLLTDTLERSIARASRRGELALLCIDLDNFKQINDSLGHPSGDLVLREVGERLSSSVRAFDQVARPGLGDPNASIARNGGDEFTILLSRIAEVADAERVARRILEQIEQPIDVAGTQLRIGASIGIAVFPRDATSAEALLRNADAALYHAKNAGRGRFHFYDVEMNRAARRRLEIRNRLGGAIERAELELHYQPRVEPATRRIVGMEALARWTDAELGVVTPAEFIPVAEDSQLLLAFSRWSLRVACEQMRRWVDAGIAPGPMSVNVSPQLFRHGDAADLVEKVLAETDLDPRNLEIELTENVLLEETDSAAEQLRRLRARGVRIAVDDFGTGYSSLRYLSHLELDTLKIDRSLIEHLGVDFQSGLIIDALVSMCGALGLNVVAEGVETDAQLDALRQRGCNELQGFLISKAVPASEFERLLWP